MRGDRLKELREEAGLSQRELSRLCNLAENMVYRYENGLSDPTSTTLKVMAENLHVSTDYLVGLTNNPAVRPDHRDLSTDEQDIIEAFRDDGWPGIFQLGAKRIAK